MIEPTTADQVFFEALIKRCNEFLFKFMYPDNQLLFGSPQHRDLVRTFFAGIAESFHEIGVLEVLLFINPELEKMCAVDWLPDERFRYMPESILVVP